MDILHCRYFIVFSHVRRIVRLLSHSQKVGGSSEIVAAVFFFLVLCLTYFLYNHFQSTTFVINTFLYPAILAGYALVFLDENFFACLSQILLFTSVKSALACAFREYRRFFRPQYSLRFFLVRTGMALLLFPTILRRGFSLLSCMIGVYFYLTRFAVKSSGKISCLILDNDDLLLCLLHRVGSLLLSGILCRPNMPP